MDSTPTLSHSSTHSIEDDTITTTTALLVGCIVVMFVMMVLGGILYMCGILIQRRKKSNICERNERSRKTSITNESDQNETNVDREYESIEDYLNTSRPANVAIDFVPNQAYASVQH